MTAKRLARAAVVALAMVAATAMAADPPRWADPAKTLRVMFPIAETGFDPHAWMYYDVDVERRKAAVK